jgi:hypothetical protein
MSIKQNIAVYSVYPVPNLLSNVLHFASPCISSVLINQLGSGFASCALSFSLETFLVS